MKKVGIMSMQRIYNYGSFLQAYALKRLIEEINNENDVTFVDFKPGTPLVQADKKESTGIKRKIEKLREYSKVDSSLINKIKFFNHKRTYGKRFYPLLEINDELNHNTDLDVLVIGSDEVFNCVQANTNVGYSRDLFGHNSKAKKVISYAGSFGNTTMKKIRDYQIEDDLKNDFSSFNAVSVRDKNSFEILSQLGIENPVINVDPVLAYDYMGTEHTIPKKRLYNEKYMIVYGYSGRITKEENVLLRKYSKKNGLKILCFGGVQGCCDEFIDCTPFELLAYFRDAEAIVTDTFHGTIFSIINNKPFVTLIRKSIGTSYGNEEKLGYLLSIFDLSDQGVNRITENNLDKTLAKKINYSEVNKELTNRRIQAKEFLLKNV
ncbi:polysaccharide pyruvyl transferase family protein [Enterococcus avium]|uniref:polysaccharide pyruvyl transferase family protein n=1 Tax=Enterococcus avium TaxID=33945 RepID=UPI0028915270|nr:polysaccharide pyruvyl transferase family protein [Enterococcus avium]MDT2391063.1 polysaccharide pyruvyl transferase family protein [Enterococcus avium]